MSSPEEKMIKKETNDIIFKYQKTDIVEKLGSILGDKFRKYREEFNKTQNYTKTGYISQQTPLTISLELVNKCNLNCIMCYKTHHRGKKEELSLNVIKKIIDECGERKIPSFILGLSSEPLISINVERVLKMIGDVGFQDIFFGTNGVLLNENIIKSVIQNGVTRIEVSLDAATRETYRKVRGFDFLDKIENNLKKLIELKKKDNLQLPLLRLCFVVMKENQHEIELFREKWQGLADYIDFQRYVDFTQVDAKIEIDQHLIKNIFCSYPFYSLNVWANGNITPCCCFYGKQLILGNIYKQSLSSVWEGHDLQVIREQINSKRLNPICIKCQYFRDHSLIDNVFK